MPSFDTDLTGSIPLHEEGQIDFTTRDARIQLAKMLMRLFEHWQLSTAAQASLLGLGPSSRAALGRYKTGKALANAPDLLERAGNLLAIHKSLRTLFPHDRELAYSWVNCPNRAFHDKTPLDIMVEYRFAGLLKIRAYLEHAASK